MGDTLKSINKHTYRGCLKSPQPSPVTPAKAGVQQKLCVATATLYLCKEDDNVPLRGACRAGCLPAQA